MRIEITIPPALMENPEQLAGRAETVFISELAELWRQYLLPSFRRTTPYRTGKLRRALQIVRDGNRLILAVKPQGFYWFLQDGLPLRYKAIYQRLLPGMVDLALIRTKEKIGLSSIDIVVIENPNSN